MVIDQLTSTPASLNGLAAERLQDMLATMYRIRSLEETLDRLYAEGRVHGTMHLCVGQEGAAVGELAALQPDDYLITTHRGHGHLVAKGGSPRRIMAEFLGKDIGYCHGLGGSMHIAAPELGHFGSNGIVGAGISIAGGIGLAIQMKGLDRVVLDIFGDGATNEGGFHEALNLASVWKLPVVFVCENNQYGMSMPIDHAVNIEHLSGRAAAYGMPGETHDGNDVLEVFEAVRTAVERARSGGGPTFLELVTYRWKGHSKSDQNRYRTRAEIEEWKLRDPIVAFKTTLIRAGLLTEDQAVVMEGEAEAEIAEAVAYADTAAEPDLERALGSVYA